MFQRDIILHNTAHCNELILLCNRRGTSWRVDRKTLAYNGSKRNTVQPCGYVPTLLAPSSGQKMKESGFPKPWHVPTKLHGVTSQKSTQLHYLHATQFLNTYITVLFVLDNQQVKFFNKVANYPMLTQVKQFSTCCLAYLFVFLPHPDRRRR